MRALSSLDDRGNPFVLPGIHVATTARRPVPDQAGAAPALDEGPLGRLRPGGQRAGASLGRAEAPPPRRVSSGHAGRVERGGDLLGAATAPDGVVGARDPADRGAARRPAAGSGSSARRAATIRPASPAHRAAAAPDASAGPAARRASASASASPARPRIWRLPALAAPAAARPASPPSRPRRRRRSGTGSSGRR